MSTEESSEMRTPLMEGGQGLAKTYGSGATVTWVQPSSTAVAKNKLSGKDTSAGIVKRGYRRDVL